MSTQNEKCWFCGTAGTETSQKYYLQKLGEHIVVDVPRCGRCSRIQRLAIILFFVLFGVITVGGIAALIMNLVSSDVAVGSGYRFGQLLGMLSVVPGLIIGIVAYKLTLKAGGTRGNRYGLEHPAVREKRAQGYVPGAPRT